MAASPGSRPRRSTRPTRHDRRPGGRADGGGVHGDGGGDWRRSAADCDEGLRRNPQHFGALSGYGMIWLQRDDPARALEQALAVNPNLESVRRTIEALGAVLITRQRDAI